MAAVCEGRVAHIGFCTRPPIPRRSCHPSSGATVQPIDAAVEGYAAEHLFDPTDEDSTPVADEPATPRELPGLAGPSADDPLKLYVRQIGDGRLLTPAQERELARRKDLGDEAAKRKLIESNLRLVMSITRNYTRADVPTPRPHPGREPRPHPRRREVRLHDGLQALDLRDVVDQAGDLARTRRAGSHDPPSRPRGGPGSQGDEDAAAARAEAQPRSVARGDRGRARHHPRARAGAARARSSTR